MEDWRLLLTEARTRVGLSQSELAAAAHVSVASIKAYERGQRHPKRPYLVALLDALKIDRGTRNHILTSAGFAADGLSLRFDMGEIAFTADEAAEEIEQYAWPAFVTDEFGQVLAANAVAQTIWGVDLRHEFTAPVDRHLLSIASNPRFADRCLNWDEAVGDIVATTWRSHRRGDEILEDPSPLFGAVLENFLAGDPKYVARLTDLWQNAPPPKRKMRFTYKIVWQVPGADVMRFQCFLSSANEPDGYMFNDWIPIDGVTWDQLGALAGETPIG